MKTADSAVKSIFVAILVLTAILFVYSLFFGNTSGSAYIGSFEVQQLRENWTLQTENGETYVNVRLPYDIKLNEGEKCLLSHQLPAHISDGMHMCIRAQRQDVEIYVNGSLRSEYSAEDVAGVRHSPESAFVFADLHSEDAGKELKIAFTAKATETGCLHEVMYAYGNNVWFLYIAKNVPLVLIAMFLALAGLISICIYYFMRWRRIAVKPVLYLSEAILAASMWILGESEIRQLFFHSTSYSSVFNFLLMEILAAFLAMFFNEIQEHRYEREYIILECGILLRVMLNMMLDLFGFASFYDTVLYSVIWSAMAIACAVTTILKDIKQKRIQKYTRTAVGMAILLIACTAEIARFYLVPSSGFGGYLGIGLLALLLATALQTAKNEMIRAEEKRLADDANRAKSFFLANMSHEIRTPINAILGMDEMILRESGDEQIRSYAGDIRDAGKNLLSLINDILDFSKVSEGRMEILPTQYDLSSVINDLVSVTRGRTEGKGLHLEVLVDETTPHLLYGDEVRIRQCAMNLLTNAVKYTESGSVTLEVGYSRISDERIALKFRVTDTGIGMTPKEIEKLYSPFDRVEDGSNTPGGGMGLGVSITQQLLMLMGSHLEVSSTYGEGSSFAFSVEQPVVKWAWVGKFTGHYEVDAALRTYHERLHAPDAQILVIDDMPLNLTVVKGLLKKTRIRIDTADSGPQAIEMASEKHYDVIFVDHMMPGMDGLETLHELKKLPWAKKTVYIALTANALTGSRERYLEAGFNDYLSKPVDPDTIEEMLMTYLPPEKIVKPTEEENGGDTQSDKSVVMIVDDDETICRLAAEILGKSFHVEACTSGAAAPGLAERLHPSLILLDIDLGNTSGFDVLRVLREQHSTSDIPVVFLTGASDEDSEIACFRSGAADFVRKPVVPEVLLQRTRRIIALDRLQRSLQSEVRRQTARAEMLTKEMMLALSKTVDAKDHYTNGHSERVAAYSAEIARRMGKTEREQQQIYEAGLMHDIGKIGVSEEIINKTEKLSDEEFEKIKRHTVIGSGILSLITQVPVLATGARSHHERYDGNGYPDGLKGTAIPETARIICIADCYDAMTSTRTYSERWSQQAVRAEIERCEGTQFDPEIARIMIQMIDEDVDYFMTERTADISVWKSSDKLWTFEEPLAEDEPEEEQPLLPEWLDGVEGLDVERGMKYCGTEDTYLKTLKIYAESTELNANEIEAMCGAGDMDGVIIKVHALKSTSRAIGADELGAFAERLELAGKAGDMQTLTSELGSLLESYRGLGERLSPLYRETEQNDAQLPMITENELHDAYDALREVLESMDYDSVTFVTDYLGRYSIPEEERERCEKIRRAADEFEWDMIGELLAN